MREYDTQITKELNAYDTTLVPRNYNNSQLNRNQRNLTRTCKRIENTQLRRVLGDKMSQLNEELVTLRTRERDILQERRQLDEEVKTIPRSERNGNHLHRPRPTRSGGFSPPPSARRPHTRDTSTIAGDEVISEEVGSMDIPSMNVIEPEMCHIDSGVGWHIDGVEKGDDPWNEDLERGLEMINAGETNAGQLGDIERENGDAPLSLLDQLIAGSQVFHPLPPGVNFETLRKEYEETFGVRFSDPVEVCY